MYYHYMDGMAGIHFGHICWGTPVPCHRVLSEHRLTGTFAGDCPSFYLSIDYHSVKYCAETDITWFFLDFTVLTVVCVADGGGIHFSSIPVNASLYSHSHTHPHCGDYSSPLDNHWKLDFEAIPVWQHNEGRSGVE